jgi:hypothetical protein
MEFHSPFPDAPYTYQPLDPIKEETRLLHVSRDERGTIQCKSTTFSLQTLPDYICLSYTWGQQIPTQRIAVNGGFLDIRVNLFNFLTEFCNIPHAHIWIDQISIDQWNRPERSQQVGLMSQIFRQAAHVVMWLGNDPVYHELASDLNEPLNVDRDTEFYSLAKLMEDEYFSRLWIVQEVFLAKEVRIMVHQGVWVLWSTIVDYNRTEPIAMLAVQPAARALLELGQETSKLHGIMDYIIEFSGNKCEDPRDRVYGLLGLTDKQLRIIPDYTKSIQEVFVDVVEALCIGYLRKEIPWRRNFGYVMCKLSKRLGIRNVKAENMRSLYADVFNVAGLADPKSLEAAIGFEYRITPHTLTSKADTLLCGRWWFEFNGEKRYYNEDF